MDFPDQQNVTPRYDQISIRDLKKENAFYQIISPNTNDEGSWIYQKTWMQIGDFTQSTTNNYSVGAEGNGVYVFVIEGSANINGQKLEKRDALGVWDTPSFELYAKKTVVYY